MHLGPNQTLFDMIDRLDIAMNTTHSCIDVPLQVTTDINAFEEEGEFYIHLPIMGHALKVGMSEYRALRKLELGDPVGPDVLETPAGRKLQKIGAIGNEVRHIPKTEPISAFKPWEATLIFTETCNLGCTYCYASSLPVKSQPMSKEIGMAALNTVLENARDRNNRLASIRYIGGGEPTVEWKFLTWATDYIRKRSKELDVQYFIRLITNGTLLTNDRVEWIAKNIQYVTLSFDVLPQLQNENRPFAGGLPTQERMLGVVRLLSKHGVKFHLRTTISSEGSTRLEEMVEYIHQNMNATSVRFEPMSEIGRTSETNLSKPRQQLFVDSFKAAYRLGQTYGIDVTCKMFKNHKRRSTRFCNTEFSVTPTGVVSACHRYSRVEHDGYSLFKIGEYKDGRFEFDLDQINGVRMIDNYSFTDCRTCQAKWSCASGCLSARISAHGISKSGPLCHLTRELLKFGIAEELRKQPA
jgi:uncharacterized protein